MNAETTIRRDIAIGERQLPGILTIPQGAAGIVLFAHGSGSSRLSPRNQYVAEVVQQGRLATLLFDLLDDTEADDRQKVFDIELLAERLGEATEWLMGREESRGLKQGYFGASTGAAAALVAAARNPRRVGAVVSRGGRPDLAQDYLERVEAPTLLIVGGRDEPVIEMNRWALELLQCEKQLKIIPEATHLFPEPGALEQVAADAREWFERHLGQEGTGKWQPT
jgi:pimeloyl-ACP methyl ester carboxylesterase